MHGLIASWWEIGKVQIRMVNSTGMDPTRLRQLRAITENLCALATRHRGNHNYVVAHALYRRALSLAQEIHTLNNGGNSLVDRIRPDQQSFFETLCSGEARQNPSLEKAKETVR